MITLKELIEKLNYKYEDREIVFAASYGSFNYGTNDETSDRDFKIFVMPTKEDLFDAKNYCDEAKIEGNDIEVHDVRKLISLWTKANPSYLEILASKEIYVNPKFETYFNAIFAMKNEIATMNLKGYYDALMGMAKQKMKAIEKDYPNSEDNEGFKRKQKFGYDTKQLLHVIRLVRMREEVFFRGKTPLEVIDLEKYDNDEKSNLFGLRTELLKVKHFKPFFSFKEPLNKEHALKYCELLLVDVKEKINYSSLKENKWAEEQLKELIKKLVLENI